MFRHRYPAVPTKLASSQDLPTLALILNAVRERVEIYGRDRGDVRDSMVRVQDLIDLGIITEDQVSQLEQR